VTDQQASTDFNKRVGANLQRFRKARGISQADLAHELSRRGFPFQQPTVLKVEKGSRPLKFEEAHAIAELLWVGPDALAAFSEDDERATAIAQQLYAASTAQRCRQEIEECRQTLERLEAELAQAELLQLDAEARLIEAGAYRGVDGYLHWRNDDGSIGVLVTGNSQQQDAEVVTYALGAGQSEANDVSA
jgi:transcriptional regulator with XRE-family HTH domain